MADKPTYESVKADLDVALRFINQGGQREERFRQRRTYLFGAHLTTKGAYTENLSANYAGHGVWRSASLNMGELPGIEIPVMPVQAEGDEEPDPKEENRAREEAERLEILLDWLLDEGNGHQEMFDAEVNRCALGEAVLRVYWEPEEKRVELINVVPEHYFWLPRGSRASKTLYDGLQYYEDVDVVRRDYSKVTFDPLVLETGQQVYRLIDYWTPDWHALVVEGLEANHWEAVEKNPYGKSPFFRICNLYVPGYGHVPLADLSALTMGLQDYMDGLFSEVATAVHENIDTTLLAINKDPQDVRDNQGGIIHLRRAGGEYEEDVKRMEGPTIPQDAFNMLSFVRSVILDFMGQNDATYGRIGGVTSAEMMYAVFQPTERWIKMKRIPLDYGLRQALKMMLHVMAVELKGETIQVYRMGTTGFKMAEVKGTEIGQYSGPIFLRWDESVLRDKLALRKIGMEEVGNDLSSPELYWEETGRGDTVRRTDSIRRFKLMPAFNKGARAVFGQEAEAALLADRIRQQGEALGGEEEGQLPGGPGGAESLPPQAPPGSEEPAA